MTPKASLFSSASFWSSIQLCSFVLCVNTSLSLGDQHEVTFKNIFGDQLYNLNFFRNIFIATFALHLSTFLTESLKIECSYRLIDYKLAECDTNSLEVKNRNESVTGISGLLSGVVDYGNIKIFKVEASPLLEYFPPGIEKFFPNLEKLVIKQTGLKELTQDDLKNFPKLKSLDVRDNQLEKLNASTFQLNEKIEELNLSGNKLTNLGSDFLKHLKNVTKIDMSGNSCINQTANDEIEMKRLRIKLAENCSGQAGMFGFSTFLLMCLFAVLFGVLLVSCIKHVVDK